MVLHNYTFRNHTLTIVVAGGKMHLFSLLNAQVTLTMPKDFQYLSKRRKNQLIKEEISCYTDRLHSTISNIACRLIQEADITFQDSDNMSCDNLRLSQNENENDELLMQLQSDVESNEVCTESESEKESNEENNVESNEEDNVESNEEDNVEIQNTILGSADCTPTSLREDLKRLIIECTIRHSTANKLLNIMRKHGHADLPKDVRLLLSTPRNASLNIKPLGDGSYMHFGLLSGLKRSIQVYFKFMKGNEVK